MSKVYLVDSENIGASWSQLLQSMSSEDKMFVFYTDKSPYISYDNLLQVIAYCSVPVFIKCYEGKNALDFQLVSELGYKLCQEPEAEFIIISDDYGYDAAVKYWKERSYHVHRIGKKYCKPMPPKKTEEVFQTVAEEAVHSGEVLCEEPAQSAVQDMPVDQKQDDEQEVTVTETESDIHEECVREPQPDVQIQVEEQIVLTEEPEQAAVYQDSLKEKQAPKRARDRGRKRKKEPATVPETEAETSVVIEEVQKEEPKEEQKDPLELLLPDITRKCGSLEPEKDAYCVWSIFHSLSMSNLTNVNTALKILIGNEMGNDIYRELKENQECRALLDTLYFPEIENRFIQYAQIVLERNGVTGVIAEEIGQFLLSIPRKNLNSIRAAIIKEYGQDKGSLIYTVFKPHIKVLNKI